MRAMSERLVRSWARKPWLSRWLANGDPGWFAAAQGKLDELKHQGTNADGVFEADPSLDAVRQAYMLWETNPSQALDEFTRMAEGGSVASMVQVGWAHEQGEGTPVDSAVAERWYSRASECGSDEGLLRSGHLAFARGDAARARAVLEPAVARGLTPAMRYLAQVELELVRTDDARDRARALLERAIAFGDVQARLNLSKAMLRGRFGLRAIPEGWRSYRRAIGEVTAQLDAERRAPRGDGDAGSVMPRNDHV